MNIQDKIEKCLRAAPKPSAPEGLLDRLRADVAVRQVNTHVGVVHRWFAPSGVAISRWRVAAAIAIMVLLPLSYGATKLIKGFISIRQISATNLGPFVNRCALSPDGKQFAGITGERRLPLAVIDLSSDERRNLAENCDPAACVWSADGSEIAVVSKSGGKRTLLAVSLKTGKTRTLMEDQRWFSLKDWSPDGKLILGERVPKPDVRSAVLVNLETKKETVLVLAEQRTAHYSFFPQFSPKGDLVSYVTKEGDRYILHLQKIDGTSHAKYMDFPGEISQPLWSPDSSHIVFTGTQSGIDRQYKDLWALRVQGNQFVGVPLPVVPDVEQMYFFNWSRNGQLAYRTGFELGGIFVLPVDSRTGKATGPPRQLVRESAFPLHCWSPDGKQIAVLQQNRHKLIFVSASTGEQIRQVSLPGDEGTLTGLGMSWSPDGRLIAFSGIGFGEKRTGVFIFTVESGDVKLLVPLETGLPLFDPTWAPDSKTITYLYKDEIYVVNVEDGKSRRLISPTEPNEVKRTRFFIRPVFAPDGNSVVYMAGDGRVLATTIDGKETREIYQFKTGKSLNHFDWSPDRRYIVYTTGNEEIWCVPIDGGEPFQINVGTKGSWTFYPKWSPKGDAISFGVMRGEFRYWVMENFLPAAEAGGR